jgi:hemerythrin-like domain-containing protein
MNGIYNVNTRLEKLSNEHKIIIDYVGKFNKSYKDRDKEFFKGLANFFNFLEKDLLAHFRYEEVILFPASIMGESNYGNTLMVMTLQKEHGIMEHQLQNLVVELKALQSSREKLSSALIEKVKAFIDFLKTHAKREMTDFYPMLNANAKSKALLAVYAKEMDTI